MCGAAAATEPIHQEAAQVVATEQVAEGVFVLRLFSDRIARAAKPGQFVHARVGVDRDFILRRPLSVHAASGQSIELLFDVKGKGTRALSRLRPHDVLDILGPLGRGFTIPDGAKRVLIVAGGMGVAPLAMLADELASRHVRMYVALGARTKARMLHLIELKRIAHEVVAVTDDGSLGERGCVTDVVPPLLHPARPDMVYACGPEAMLEVVARQVQPYDIPCEVSLERLMACGVGACLSCAVRTTDGVKRACADGPVFDAREVVWRW